MPRHPRIHTPANVYHVVIKGTNRQLLFEEKKDFRKYLEVLRFFKKECDFEIYAYCLMSNHVHLLIKTNSVQLSSVFRRINTSYAIWFNSKYERTGHLQNDRFYSEPVESSNYLLNVVRYIHYNPTKSGLEDIPGEKYPWNSYLEYLDETYDLISPNQVLTLFGGKENMEEFHNSQPTEECLDIDKIRKRLPDDIAKDIILETTNCHTATDFQNLNLSDRNKFIPLLHKKGISIRQLNRLTGISIGTIQNLISVDKKD